MDIDYSKISDLVDAERVKKLAFDFVKIPSPTGDESKFAEFYAETLKTIGLDVNMDYEFSSSPSVIAKLRGNKPGPTIQFDGHLDHIPVEHPSPEIKDDIIYGRGIADMKSGLAAMAEAVRVIKELGFPLNGTIMLTAHGLHEAPLGHNETLESLMRKNIYGDACVVGEVASNFIPLVGKGMIIFEFVITRPGEVLHETKAPDGVNPILAGQKLIELLRINVDKIGGQNYYGKKKSETIFFGIFESGDFYNRIPTKCRIVGTRRFSPGRAFQDVEEEFEGIIKKIESSFNVEIKVDLSRIGLPFKVNRNEKIVISLRNAYEHVVKEKLSFGATDTVGNAPWFINLANIPTVYHGVDQSTAHSDLEYVKISDIVRAAKVYVLTALNYLL